MVEDQLHVSAGVDVAVEVGVAVAESVGVGGFGRGYGAYTSEFLDRAGARVDDVGEAFGVGDVLALACFLVDYAPNGANLAFFNLGGEKYDNSKKNIVGRFIVPQTTNDLFKIKLVDLDSFVDDEEKFLYAQIMQKRFK